MYGGTSEIKLRRDHEFQSGRSFVNSSALCGCERLAEELHSLAHILLWVFQTAVPSAKLHSAPGRTLKGRGKVRLGRDSDPLLALEMI